MTERESMPTVVISDLHGDYENLWRIIRDTGIVDSDKEYFEVEDDLPVKRDDAYVIFVGDIADFGRMAEPHEDAATLRLAAKYGDVFIPGNHEMPYLYSFGGREMGFGGMRNELESGIQDALRIVRWEIEWVPAVEVNGWLVTHAGLHPDHLRDLGNPEDAYEAAYALPERFKACVFDRQEWPYVFTGVDYLRGGYGVGGIFWTDVKTLLGAGPSRIPQIVGHSYIGPDPILANNVWYIDTGKGHPAALVWNEEGEVWEPYTTAPQSLSR